MQLPQRGMVVVRDDGVDTVASSGAIGTAGSGRHRHVPMRGIERVAHSLSGSLPHPLGRVRSWWLRSQNLDHVLAALSNLEPMPSGMPRVGLGLPQVLLDGGRRRPRYATARLPVFQRPSTVLAVDLYTCVYPEHEQAQRSSPNSEFLWTTFLQGQIQKDQVRGRPSGTRRSTCGPGCLPPGFGDRRGPTVHVDPRQSVQLAGTSARIDVNRIIVRAAKAAGIDATGYPGHSLRAGLATSATARGASERSIQAVTGRHEHHNAAPLHPVGQPVRRDRRNAGSVTRPNQIPIPRPKRVSAGSPKSLRLAPRVARACSPYPTARSPICVMRCGAPVEACGHAGTGEGPRGVRSGARPDALRGDQPQYTLLSVGEILRRAGCEVLVARSLEENRAALASGSWDAAIIDRNAVVAPGDFGPDGSPPADPPRGSSLYRNVLTAVETMTGRPLRSPSRGRRSRWSKTSR